jgi:hypothetical protein
MGFGSERLPAIDFAHADLDLSLEAAATNLCRGARNLAALGGAGATVN